jgi:hypothetical protein
MLYNPEVEIASFNNPRTTQSTILYDAHSRNVILALNKYIHGIVWLQNTLIMQKLMFKIHDDSNTETRQMLP